VTSKDLDEGGNVAPGAPQAVVVRTPDARLIYYAATGSRSKTALKGLGVLDGYRGYLVSDDYAGYRQFEADLAGRQQCCAHLLRYLAGVYELDPAVQAWAPEVAMVLRQAHTAVTDATAAGRDQLDPQLLADLRTRRVIHEPR
jgi:transposase